MNSHMQYSHATINQQHAPNRKKNLGIQMGIQKSKPTLTEDIRAITVER